MSSINAQVLYSKDGHECIALNSLMSGESVQSNQFLIIDSQRAALIDPGGDLTFTPLSIEISRRIRPEALDYVLASHQDPDIISSMPRWLMHSQAKIVCPQIWARFLPHLASGFVTDRLTESLSERLIAIPDPGTRLPLGQAELVVLPAHFLHSVGNFHFYDPISKILFSGDLGASMTDNAEQSVTEFHPEQRGMKSFHQRYMVANKVARLWVDMIRQLDVDMIVPQHGRALIGPKAVEAFLTWVERSPCGIDLLDESHYRCPV